MTARCHAIRAAALTVLGLAVLVPPAAAQNVPVVFVHGIFSSGDTWRASSQRLATLVQIEPHVVDLPSTAVLETQTATLNGAKGQMPSSTIAVGHSQGGLISRQWSRTKALTGIVTLGTPHTGSQLTARALDLINFNYLIYNLAGLAGTFGTGTEFSWVAAALQVYFANTQSLAWSVGTALTSTVAVANHVPVAPQLVPGSSFLANLNTAGNLAREHSAISRRVALAYTADQYWRAGAAVGLAPEHREWAWWVMLVSPPAFEYGAAFVDANYGPTNLLARSFAARLRELAGFIREMDPKWCWAVTGDRQCRIPHDGIVSVDNQAYPGPGALTFGVTGPAHTQETRQSDGHIASVLTGLLGVAPRGAAPPPPAPGGGGGNGGGAGSLTGGQRLYPDQQFTSAGGSVALRYQSDGNLVLYGANGTALWASGTSGTSAGRAEFQADGNFVIYTGGGTPIWATDTYAPGGYLQLHDAGYFMVYDASNVGIWWSGSGNP